MEGLYIPSPSPQTVQTSFTGAGAGNTLTCRGRFNVTLSGDGEGTYSLQCKRPGGGWATISKNVDGDPFVVTKGAADSFAFPVDEAESDTLYRWNALTHTGGTTAASLRIGGGLPLNPFFRNGAGPNVFSHVFPHVRAHVLVPAATGPSYDPEAQAYIDATGELFPDDLNTLVLGIKAASLWDNHLGSIKKAIGVPSLAASMIDLRNTAFNGTAVNTPTQSATQGWGFTATSSQYIDSAWQCGATDSKGAQDSVHVGARTLTSMVRVSSIETAAGVNALGLHALTSFNKRGYANDSTSFQDSTSLSLPCRAIVTRTGATARKLYIDGAVAASDATASTGVAAGTMPIGCNLRIGTGYTNFATGRLSLWHAGAGLDDTQAAALTTLFDAYATAAGEA